MTVYAGIDYSMTSPAWIAWDDSNPLLWDNMSAVCMSGSPKILARAGEVVWVYDIKKELKDIERYSYLSDVVVNELCFMDVEHVFLEGYAYGARGMVFNIGENTGLLKYKMFEQGITYDIIAPTAIKKFATGKGNASKEMMQEVFIEETSLNLKTYFNQTDKQWNPSSDVIDAYYILKCGLDLNS